MHMRTHVHPFVLTATTTKQHSHHPRQMLTTSLRMKEEYFFDKVTRDLTPLAIT